MTKGKKIAGVTRRPTGRSADARPVPSPAGSHSVKS